MLIPWRPYLVSPHWAWCEQLGFSMTRIRSSRQMFHTLRRGKQNDTLHNFSSTHHVDAKKADLATTFVERCRAFSREDGKGSLAVVTPQNWLFLKRYRALRDKLLREQEWDHITRLWEKFKSTAAAGAFTALIVLTNHYPRSKHTIMVIDASEPKTALGKAMWIRNVPLREIMQTKQLTNVVSRMG